MADNDGQSTVADSSQTVLSDSLSDGEASVVEQDGSAVEQDSGSVALPKWTEQTPTEYREKLKGYQTYKDFLKDATELLDRKDSLVTVPGEGASDEQWDQFFSSVGRPSDPEGYGIEGKDELVKEFSSVAHKSGLSVTQAKSLLEWYQGALEKQGTTIQENLKAETERVQTQLKEEWAGDYDKNMESLKRFGKKYGSDEIKKVLSDPAIGNNPVLIKLLSRAGADLVSERMVDGKPSSPQEADDTGILSYPWMREAYPTKPE